ECAVRPVLRRTQRVEVVREHLLALADLLCDTRLQRIVSAKVADTRAALHLNEATRDDAPGDVEVEESKVSSLEADLVTQLVSPLLQYTIQIKVRIERDDDLVLEDTLVLEVQTRESEAERFRPLSRRRDELERESSG